MPSFNRTLGALMGLSLLAMPGAASAMQAKTAEKQPDKMVCKKVGETGSLVKKTKVCLTRSQWERSATRGSEYSRELQEGLRGRPSGQ